MTPKVRIASAGTIFAIALVAIALGLPGFQAAWIGVSAVLFIELMAFVNSPGIDYWVGIDRADLALLNTLLVASGLIGWAAVSLLFWAVDLAVRLPGGLS